MAKCLFTPTGFSTDATESGASATGTPPATTGFSTDATESGVSATDTPPTTSATPTTTSADTSAVVPLEVACGLPPGGASGAEYQHQPTASGGVPEYQWSAVGLPEGLMIHPDTGEIYGVPNAVGNYVVEIAIEDAAANVAMSACPDMVIGGRLTVDYDALAAAGPCIATGGETILEYLKGGDGSAITCGIPGSVGDGVIPGGLGVDPHTCAVTGTLDEQRHGGWAWIVTAEQSGVQVHAPYCATQPQQPPKAYSIVGSHSGLVGNTLIPMVVKVSADLPLLLDGDADPHFEITGTLCGASCFFGFVYRVSPSPFGSGPCTADADSCFGLCPLVADADQPDGDTAKQCSLLPENGSPKIGFAHEIWAKGEALPEEFEGRPFIMQWSIDYCLSDFGADCQGKEAVLANGDNTNLEFPVIFYSE